MSSAANTRPSSSPSDMPPDNISIMHSAQATTSSTSDDRGLTRDHPDLIAVASEQSSLDASEALYRVATTLIEQVISLLENTITTDEQLCLVSDLVPGSTIGKHLRHVHDHFRLLLDSLNSFPAKPSSPSSPKSRRRPVSSPTTLELSYDKRLRSGPAETSHSAALESFIDLQHRLEDDTSKGRGIPSSLKIQLEAVTPIAVTVETTWSRELWFASLHAIHHFSLLRVIAVGECHLEVPSDFGVAPSTLTFRKWDGGSEKAKSDRISKQQGDQKRQSKL